MKSDMQLSNLATPPEQSSFQKNSNFDQKHLLGGIAIIVGLFIILLIVLFFVCFKKKIKLRFKNRVKLDAEKLVLRKFNYEELQKATNDFSTDSLVGYGAFGNVYRGTFPTEGTLAIKELLPSSRTSIQEFQNEVILISKVKHENLVRLVGFCEPGSKGRKLLIYEYVCNGSLLDYIMGREGRSLTWKQRVTIAIGSAKGIAYLHEEMKPSIIHRDLKPSNILVGEHFEAKVSDFGLVKTGPIDDQSHVSTQVKGTPGYLDPAYCSTYHVSPFTDVYSFGVILLQLVSGRPAVTSTRGRPNIHITDWARRGLEGGRIEEILDANLVYHNCNMEIMLKMGQLGLRCVVSEPKKRPTMTQVRQELEATLYSIDPSSIHLQQTFDETTNEDNKNRLSRKLGSQNSISLDNIGLQKFHVEMDSLSFNSESLRCFEAKSVSIDVATLNLHG